VGAARQGALGMRGTREIGLIDLSEDRANDM
jgi:hypothetical protein